MRPHDRLDGVAEALLLGGLPQPVVPSPSSAPTSDGTFDRTFDRTFDGTLDGASEPVFELPRQLERRRRRDLPRHAAERHVPHLAQLLRVGVPTQLLALYRHRRRDV